MSHYETLEVSRNASFEVIRAAYKSLIQRYHPDKNPDNAAAATKAQQVSVAYAILSVPESRAAYDEQLDLAKKLTVCPNTPPPRSPSDLRNTQPPPRQAEPVAAQRNVIQSEKQDQVTSIKYVLTILVVVGILFYWMSTAIDAQRNRQEEQLAKQFAAEKQANIEKEDEKRQELEAQKEKEKQIEALDISRRTLTLFPKGITLNLVVSGSSPERLSGRSVVIPQISIIVGKIDSERVLRNLQLNEEILRQAIFEELSRIDERVLISLGAEQYVRAIIKTTINKIILGPAYRDELCRSVLPKQLNGAEEWQCLAIETVTLPQFLIVQNQNAGISPSTGNLPFTSSGSVRANQRLHPSMSKEEVYRILGTTGQ